MMRFIVQHQMIDVARLSRTCSIRAVSRDHGTLKTKTAKKLCYINCMHFHKLKKNKGWYLEDGYMKQLNKSHTQDG
jgi:uncharacterized protein YvpB